MAIPRRTSTLLSALLLVGSLARAEGPAPQLAPEVLQAMSELDPKAPSMIDKSTAYAKNFAAGFASFNVAMGAIETWKCYDSNDPLICKLFVQSLQEPSGYISFLLFAQTAQLVELGSARLKIPPVAGSMLGMASGALVAQTSMELYNHPLMAEYFKTAKIIDPKERDAKRKEIRKKLFEATFADPEWRLEKVPQLLTLMAATATVRTTRAIGQKAVAKTNQALGSWLATATAETPFKCFLKRIHDSANAFATSVSDAVPDWVVKRGMETYSILAFLSWNEILSNLVTEPLWDSKVSEPRFQALQQKLRAAVEDFARDPNPDRAKELSSLLEKSGKAWDRRRQHLLASVQPVQARYLKDLTDFDEKATRSYLFYSWFISGMKEDSAQWDALRSTQYDGDTKPQDIRKDTEKYLRGFFCGLPPEQSFTTRFRNFSSGLTAKPYRVIDRTDLCDKTADELAAEVTRPEYKRALQEAQARFQAGVAPSRDKRIKHYESLIEKELTRSLGESMKSFDSQGERLKEIQEKLKGHPLESEVERQLQRSSEARASAQELLDYISAPQDKRIKPEVDIFALFGGGASAKTDENPAARTYDSLILR